MKRGSFIEKAERIIVRKSEVFFKKKGGEQVSYTVNLHAYLQ